MATDNLEKLEKQAASIQKMLSKAKRLAQGGDPNRGGGQNKKTLEQHVADGTYSAYRHGPKVDLSLAFTEKPPHRRPYQRKKYPVPGGWIDRWKERGVWTPNDELAIEKGCWFDPKQAEHFRDFCHNNLSLWEGKQWAGKPFVLMDWQWLDVFSKLFGWFKWNAEWECVERRFSHAFIFVPKKQGKALALPTMLPTPTGWTTMGEVSPGDKLFDEHGEPCMVTGITNTQRNRPCYRVTFSDGTNIVADAAHEWYTETRKPQDGCGIKTTEEIKATLAHQKGRNHTIPVAGALNLPQQSVPIPPYVFGCWLGDGSSDCAVLTCGAGDKELLEHVREAGTTAVVTRQRAGALRVRLGSKRDSATCRRGHDRATWWKRGRCQRCEHVVSKARRAGGSMPPNTHEPLYLQLRQIGVLNNKHIPRNYLRASVTQRLELLQGLMDTDGHCTVDGQCEFTTIRPALRDGVLELIRSLGLKPHLVTGRARLNGRDCGEKYRIQFYAFRDFPVFRLHRKRARQKARPESRTRSQIRKIVSIEPVPSVPVKCIEVDSVSHLYLAGEGMVPTHNSPMAAAVGGYCMAADGEMGGKVLSAASAREQASIVHGHAMNMIQASEALSARCKINRSTSTVTFEHPDLFKHAGPMDRAPANNVYRSISSEAGPQEGQNTNCILGDEIHAWYGRKLWNTLEYAFESRISPLFFMITTAGDDEQSVCFEQYEYAKDVASGHIQDIGFLPYICEAQKDDDFDDPETWRKANPSMGVTITEARFREMWEKAKRTSNAAVSSFKRYRFNIWGTVADPLLDPDAWDACYEAFTPESMFGRPCYGGLDLSKSMDMTAFNLMFPDDEQVRQLCWFWLPEEMFEKNRGRVPYQEWIDEGWLELCPGAALDYDVVAKRIKWAAEQFRLSSVRFDPYKGQVVIPDLTKAGIQCAEFPQVPKYFADPASEYQRMVLQATLRHNGNGCLTWQSRHVKGKTDANQNVRPVKGERGGIRAIDGIVAGIMALDGKMREPVKGKSYYATHEMEIF